MGGILCTPPFLSELLFPPLCLGLLGMTQETKLRASAGGGGALEMICAAIFIPWAQILGFAIVVAGNIH